MKIKMREILLGDPEVKGESPIKVINYLINSVNCVRLRSFVIMSRNICLLSAYVIHTPMVC